MTDPNTQLAFEVMLRRGFLHLVKQQGGEVVFMADDLQHPEEGLAWKVFDNPSRVLVRVISQERQDQLRAEGAQLY